MKTEILKILNNGCVHLPTVDEWMKISEILCQKKHGGYGYISATVNLRNSEMINLMQRFEELVRGKKVKLLKKINEEFSRKGWQPALLRKEMFVCDPDYFTDKETGEQNINEYKQAQLKVWFEVFESLNDDSVHISGHLFIIGDGGYVFTDSSKVYKATVFDFIIELDRYNRTAKKPIKINFTENFVNELLK